MHISQKTRKWFVHCVFWNSIRWLPHRFILSAVMVRSSHGRKRPPTKWMRQCLMENLRRLAQKSLIRVLISSQTLAGACLSATTSTRKGPRLCAQPSIPPPIFLSLDSRPEFSVYGKCPHLQIFTHSAYPRKKFHLLPSTRQVNGSPLALKNSVNFSFGNGNPNHIS